MHKTDFLNLILIALAISACSTSQSYHNRTGFFKDYSGFKPVERESLLFFHQEKGADLSSYTKILVPEIQVLPHSSAPMGEDNRLYAEISAYATAAYRKNIIKNSANYKLVDVPQQGTMVIQIALSMVEVYPDDKGWDPLSALPFTLDASTYSVYAEGSARLLVEAQITDAVSGKRLAGSMRVINEEKITVKSRHLRFQDIQMALDTWLYEVALKH